MSVSKRAWRGLATLVVFGLIAAGCGDDDDGGGDSAAGGDGDGSIWVLLPDTASSDRWEKDDRRFFAEAFEEAGLSEGDDFTIVNAEGDAATQQSQAEQAIADGASVIVLTSLDTGSGATIIDQAKDADVKVVEYDRFNTGGSGGDAYVSFDNVEVGAAMAEAVEPAIDALGVAPARVVMLNGGEEDNNSFLFKQGYAETVDARVDAGDWELVADQFVPGWDNQEAQTLMEQILVDANNDVDAVFAANDGLANSVINALEAAGVGPVPLSGQDATAAGIQNVLLGKQTVSVYKPIQDEAGVAAAIALALRNGDDIEEAATSYSSTLAVGRRRRGDHRHRGRERRARRLRRRRRRRALRRPGPDRRDRRQRRRHGHRGRVPDRGRALHRRGGQHPVLPAELVTTPLLELEGVSKAFGAVQALHRVDFEVRRGEVMALVGDNGAGKSTLIKCVAGIYPFDEGQLRFEGERVNIHGPRGAGRLGIEVVYQDLALADNLDVTANMFLGRERTRRGFVLDESTMEHAAQETLESLSVTTLGSVRKKVAGLSGGQRQAVAVAKSVMWNSKLLILDEPTAALGVAQTRQVLDLVRRLADRDLGVLLVSHNLHDVFEVADRITVLRLGQRVAMLERSETTQQEVVHAITAGTVGHVPGMSDMGAAEQ